VAVVFKSMLVAAALFLGGFGAADAVWAKDSTKPIDTSKTPKKIAMPPSFVVVGYGPPVNSSSASLRCPGESKSTWVTSICDFAPPRPNLPANFRRHKLEALTPNSTPFPRKFRYVAAPVAAMPDSMTLMPKRPALSRKLRSIKVRPIQTYSAGYVPGSTLSPSR